MKSVVALLLPMGITTALSFPFLTPACMSGNPGAVYYCSNARFGGDCVYRPANDDCFAPPDAPVSIGPDKGGYCVLFEDRECKGSIIHYDEKNPGIKWVQDDFSHI